MILYYITLSFIILYYIIFIFFYIILYGTYMEHIWKINGRFCCFCHFVHVWFIFFLNYHWKFTFFWMPHQWQWLLGTGLVWWDGRGSLHWDDDRGCGGTMGHLDLVVSVCWHFVSALISILECWNRKTSSSPIVFVSPTEEPSPNFSDVISSWCLWSFLLIFGWRRSCCRGLQRTGARSVFPFCEPWKSWSRQPAKFLKDAS